MLCPPDSLLHLQLSNTSYWTCLRPRWPPVSASQGAPLITNGPPLRDSCQQTQKFQIHLQPWNTLEMIKQAKGRTWPRAMFIPPQSPMTPQIDSSVLYFLCPHRNCDVRTLSLIRSESFPWTNRKSGLNSHSSWSQKDRPIVYTG